MKDWQRYALHCFKPEEFYHMPLSYRYHPSHYFSRFCSYDEFKLDTLERSGCIASACLSLLFKPETIVEFGVNAGWTSLLLCRLNPDAWVHGVDFVGRLPNQDFPTGMVPLLHNVPNYSLHIMNSWEFDMSGSVDLCFIDADHFIPNVEKDCWTAWENRNVDGDWCIAWDDYHPSNPDVLNTVDDFVKQVGYPLQKIGSWYWIGTKIIGENDLSDIPWEE